MTSNTSSTFVDEFAERVHSRKTKQVGSVTATIAAMRREPEPPRRSFLRGLVSLPLIGGGVTLIGEPSAAAVPITGGMVATYLAWLHFEQRYVSWAVGAKGFVPMMNPGASFHGVHGEHPTTTARKALHRAPIILAAAGCQLTNAEADEHEAYLGPSSWIEGVR